MSYNLSCKNSHFYDKKHYLKQYAFYALRRQWSLVRLQSSAPYLTGFQPFQFFLGDQTVTIR